MELERTVENLRSLYRNKKYLFGVDETDSIYAHWQETVSDGEVIYKYIISNPCREEIVSKLVVHRKEADGKDAAKTIETTLTIESTSQYDGPIIRWVSEKDSVIWLSKVFSGGAAWSDNVLFRARYTDANNRRLLFREGRIIAEMILKEIERRLMKDIPAYFFLPDCIPAGVVRTEYGLPVGKLIAL